MFALLSLASVLLVTLSECSFNVELNNGGEITFSRNEVSGLSSLTSGVACGLPNRLAFPVRFDLEQGFKSFRSSLKSSAMYNIKWSKKLANYAQERSDKCDMGFRFPKSCDALYYTSLGGYSTLKDYDIAAFLESMYKESEQYDADNNRCKTEGACTFFKYLARDTLAEFGCASTKCEALVMHDGSVMNNAVRTVCYLANGMDLHHVPSDRKVPYSSTGAVCSKCNDLIKGGYTCVNSLCEDKCTSGSCVCKIEKKCPGGLFNKETCACECNKGFFGNKCQYPCKCVNTISDCSGFSSFCDNTQYTSYTRIYCSAECPRVCKVIKPAPRLKSCQE